MLFDDEDAIIDYVTATLKCSFTLFDVGAAEGAYTDEVREHCGPFIAAHLFEPRSGAAQLLSAKYAHAENIVIVNAAVGDVVERAKLTLGTNDICQSHLRGVFEGEAWEEVNVITIDSYLENFAAGDPIFLKIDTEGYELPVLRGAEKAISTGRIPVIQFEYGGTWGPDSPWSTTLQAASDLLSGFSIFEYRGGSLQQILDTADHYEYRNYLAIKES